MKKGHGLNVGELLDFIEKHKISRDAVVLIQRVEDKYFNGIDISGMYGTLPGGGVGILPEGSKSTGWEVEELPSLDHSGTTQYFRSWCVVSRDNKNIYIENHY